jgi:glycerol-3-phosphate dehydrogenase
MKTDFELIIVGAGINGAGIARDATMRGLKVLLVDKSDIGGGTSAGSTRLIHGGLRYLEHFEFGLVRESLRERETLLRIAPHLVRPLPITIPIYKQSQRGRATIRAGMIAYDLLSLGKSLPRHRMQSLRETIEKLPGLNQDELLGSAVYCDAQVEFAERLVWENVLAALQHGATVCTYTPVTKLLIEEGSVRGVELEGSSVRAEMVINAAGPWLDRLLDYRLIGGTKGSHIVVAPFAGAPATAVYLEAASDQRPFFVIAWNGNYLIGTTDVRFEANPDLVRTEPWEIDYLLTETNRAFPNAQLTRELVLYTYSGVRPLPFTANQDEQSITRRHFIREHPRYKNLLSIVGGKLTTYRNLAEECVDLVFRKLGRRVPPCETANVRLPGAINGSPANVCERWRRIYGSRAKELAEFAKRFDNQDPLIAEIVFSFECEFARTLADCFLRRTMLGLNADLGLGQIQIAANAGTQFLGWTEDRARHEVENYQNEISRMICH